MREIDGINSSTMPDNPTLSAYAEAKSEVLGRQEEGPVERSVHATKDALGDTVKGVVVGTALVAGAAAEIGKSVAEKGRDAALAVTSAVLDSAIASVAETIQPKKEFPVFPSQDGNDGQKPHLEAVRDEDSKPPGSKS